jgi:rRNA-processing protein FCF1
MRAVIDSSSWISLARAGLLGLIPAVPVEPVLLDVVQAEIVAEGRRGGHADASAITAAVADTPVMPTEDRERSIDARVLNAARRVGVLIANDLSLGRRARSLGVQWIRSADMLVIALRSGSISSAAALDGVRALEQAGRITRELADAYRDTLR